MPEKKPAGARPGPHHAHQPKGFTPRSGKAASEYAREQGWQMNEEQRAETPREKQDYDGGADYDYGARDFGDLPTDTSSAQPPTKKGGPAKKSAQGQPAKKKKVA